MIVVLPHWSFQSTLPQGEWLAWLNNRKPDLWFQSTLPQGEWQQQFQKQTQLTSFQSTLPQGEWPDDVVVVYMTHLISIHTPTRGVTWRSDYLDSWHRYFNPHSHKGSDARFNNNDDFIDISIHTPTRGVTRNVSFEDGAINDFNPHSHKGSDSICCSCGSISRQFQSTLPQGEWRGCAC